MTMLVFVQITLQHYDRSKSSTDKVVQCNDAACRNASAWAGDGACTTAGSSQACSYSIRYADGVSSSNGYLVNDALTFQNSMNDTANIFIGSAAHI